MKQDTHVTAKASSTRDRLLTSALNLFSRFWYETVSVAEICRNAELSNGIFYRYFNRKDEIFKELLEQYLVIITDHLSRIRGKSIADRTSSLVDALIDHIRRYKDLVRVYREGQYRFPEYERRLRSIYVDAGARVLGRELSEAEYLYLVAGVRFVGIRHVLNDSPIDKKLLKQTILHGMFHNPPGDVSALIPDTIRTLEPEESSSRNRLIESGIRLFGASGFYNVNVYDVARAADFSVGTFYLYFATKESFLAQIVTLIGRRTRRFISQNLTPGVNRVEREIQGILLFLRYFTEHPEYYSIVREAEFVVGDEVREYYDRFVAGYLKDLTETGLSTARQKRVLANSLLGIAHYLGIDLFFADSVAAADESRILSDLGRLMNTGVDGA
jgi:AcrR family transcriptional regulator